jgi:GAF domain-containing protein/two-component sensor histidine kinase
MTMNFDIVEKPEQNMTAQRLKSLYELIERINSVYDLPELLEFVVDRTLSLTGGRHGLLLLNDNHNYSKFENVAVVRGKNLNPDELKNPLNLVSTSVINDTIEHGEPRLVVDLQLDERFSGRTSDNTQQHKRVRSVLTVPLKVKSQLIGLIYIDHPRRAIFGQEDLDFLSAFANQVALAIHRGREHQRQIEELTLLNTLSRSVVQVLDLDEVLTRIVHEATLMLGVESGSVILVDETTNDLIFATAISNRQRITIPTRLKKGQGIAGWVIATGERACVGDVTKDPRWFGEVETGFNFVTRSLLCVPLQLRGRILGALEVFNKRSPLGFDPSDATRLTAFAGSATVALENARLFQEARQADQLRALHEVALALSSSLDLKTILNEGIEHACRILRSKACVISFVDGQIDMPPLLVSQGLLSENPAIAAQQKDEINQLVALRLSKTIDEPLIINNLQPDHELSLEAIRAAGIQALALAPIKVGNKMSGALAVMNPAGQVYGPDEANLLVSLARIIGLAAQNALHYDQANKQAMRLTYLNEVGTALISSLDLRHILEVIIDGVNSLLETERTSVFIVDTETNELVLSFSNQGDAEIRLPAPWQGIAGWVATHDQPTLVNDTISDPRHLRQVALETGYEAHSILCVPLKVEDKIIGVVEVLNKTGGLQFNHEHLVMLTEFSRWAAIAIQNARLFRERDQAIRHLASEQERRGAAEARNAMASVILDIAHTMNNVVGAIRVWASTLEYASHNTPNLPIIRYQKEMIHIRQNAEEAIKLIRNMTDPLKEAEIAPTEVHLCLAEAIKSCWWPDNVKLSRDYGKDVPLVKANSKRLEAAFNNLLSNAVQALAETGGLITVKTERTATGQARISIHDNGPGIPAELQKSIFKKPRISSHSKGLGIGLWLVETFIDQFEGEIDFTSNSEIGTTFVITLQPLASIS